MRRDWVISPESIIRRALIWKLIDIEEANSRSVRDAAHAEAERLRDEWPEGEGFGSSDATATVATVLREAGLDVGYVGGRLTRIATELRRIAGIIARQPKENTPFKRDDEGYATVTFKIKGDALYSLLKLIKQCEYMGNVGHTFTIVVDPQGGKEYKREVGFDGDGDARVKDILVNGEPLPEKFEW